MADTTLDRLDAERAAYKAGLVPFMGEWEQTFVLRPVPYSTSGAARMTFKREVSERLTNRFMFSRFIEVTIRLQLDAQTVMESDAYGDLDNYSKSINDALKGRDGLFIDDCQIYHLEIGFLLTLGTAFHVKIKAMLPDEFVLKEGLKLYGMSDGLYYPQAEAIWESSQVERLDKFNMFAGLIIWDTMTRSKRSLRHDLRSAGATKLTAFQYARPVMPLQLGFHRSRAVTSGLEIVEHEAWREACTRYADTDGRIGELKSNVTEYARAIAESGEHLSDLIGQPRHRPTNSEGTGGA
jgi:Holliday junction resolvase RusA-like endonuclease